MHAPRTRSRWLPPVPALLGALFLTLAPAPHAAFAAANAWPFEWRPCWIPGDPMDDAAGADLWAAIATPGLFVAIDPVTHRPVAPSIEQRWAFQSSIDALLAPTAPVRVEALPGRGEIAHLNGAFQSFSIARRDASGRFVTDCAPDAETARRLLAAPLPAATPKEER